MKSRATLQDWIAAHPGAVSLVTLAVPFAILVISAVEMGPSAFSSHFATGMRNFLGYFDAFFISASFAAFLVVILVLERFRPADPDQAMFSRGLMFDIGFCVIALAFQFFVISALATLYVGFFARHVPPLTALIGHLPNWLRFLIIFVAADFGSWLSHVIRHKIPVLWHFHALHHSQNAMNFMTEFRLHPADMVAGTFVFCLLFVLVLVPVEQAFALLLLRKYYLMFLHANVDISYGPLDRVFVSPRVHRLHHAIRSDLHDQNYGVYLSIWDTLFGTFRQVPDRVIKTGVEGFPDERDGPWFRMPLTFLRQLAFPVTQAAQSLRSALTAQRRT